MNRTLVTLLTLALFTTPVCRAQDERPAKPVNPKLVKTFTASKPLNLEVVVADFVIDLIHKNTAGVQDKYRKLTAESEETAGARYRTNRFQGIQWFVNDLSRERGEDSTLEGDYIYLARQQLVVGHNRGYTVPVNVIGQVHVVTSEPSAADAPAAKEGWVPAGAKITLTFEGFLDEVPVRQAP